PMYLGIGLAQCVSMIPGVSRSGATIIAAMLLGADRRSAAEFSFWLAMPTMAGAFAYDLFKSRGQMSLDNSILVAFGFAVSFVCAWIVVKTFLDYVQRHGFALFAWWRVVVGALGLIALAMGPCAPPGRPAGALAVVARRPLELAGLAKPPQIGGRDGGHSERLDAERLQRAAFALGLFRDDGVAAQELDLIGRQQWLGQQLKEAG